MICFLLLLFVFYFVIDFEMKCIIYKFIFIVLRIYINYYFFWYLICVMYRKMNMDCFKKLIFDI